MNIIRKISLNIDGIRGTIRKYTSDAYVINICDRLKSALEENNLEEIEYLLIELIKWYEDNQIKIQRNEFVHNKEIHIKIQNDLIEYVSEVSHYIEENGDNKKIEGENKVNLNNNKVFIVHGHDELALEQVTSFIKDIKLEPIVLKNQASGGKTIIEKIEEYSDVGFAIVLYTPCDVVASINDSENLQHRARQNVVFEHGYLVGKIGRSNVCALVKGDVEKPNDISGVVYIDLDNQKAWRFSVAKELKQLGYDVDVNNLI